MINWVNYIIESGVLLALLLLFYTVFLSNEKCINYNRFYLLLTVLASAFIPFINLPFAFITQKNNVVLEPIYDLPAVVSQITTFQPAANSGTQQLVHLLLIAYILGVVYFTYAFSLKITGLVRLIRTASISQAGSHFKVVLTHGKHPSFSFYKYIFLNEVGKTTQELEAIIAHEQAHIKQKHSIDILIIELYKIIFWFNPLSYRLDKVVRLNHEYLADHSAVKQQGKHPYIKTLLSQIYQHTVMGVVHYFGLHSTEKRIRMIQQNIQWSSLVKPYISVPFITILFFAFSCHLQPDTILPTTLGIEKAPREFEAIMDSYRKEHPERSYFFKFTANPEFERIKALDYKHFTIDYVACLKGYTNGYGLIYSFAKSEKLSEAIFRTKVYSIEQTTQIPIPWEGYQKLLEKIDSYANNRVKVNEEKTIWVSFVVNATGSIWNTNITGLPYTHMSDQQAKEYGAVINAVNVVSRGQWRSGKIEHTAVNVRIELPVRLYKD